MGPQKRRRPLPIRATPLSAVKCGTVVGGSGAIEPSTARHRSPSPPAPPSGGVPVLPCLGWPGPGRDAHPTRHRIDASHRGPNMPCRSSALGALRGGNPTPNASAVHSPWVRLQVGPCAQGARADRFGRVVKKGVACQLPVCLWVCTLKAGCSAGRCCPGRPHKGGGARGVAALGARWAHAQRGGAVGCAHKAGAVTGGALWMALYGSSLRGFTNTSNIRVAAGFTAVYKSRDGSRSIKRGFM